MFRYFSRNYVLVLVRETYAVFYKVSNLNIEMLHVIPFNKGYEEVKDLIVSLQRFPMKIFLDIGSESIKKISIPDSSYVSLKKVLADSLREELKKYKIVFPVLLNRPSVKNINWEYIFLRLAVGKDVDEFISFLGRSFSKIQGVYLSQVNNIKLANALLLKNNDSSLKSSIFLLNSQEIVREFKYENKKLIDVKKYSLSLEKFSRVVLEKTTNSNLDDGKLDKESFALVSNQTNLTNKGRVIFKSLSYKEASDQLVVCNTKDSRDNIMLSYFVKNNCESVDIPSIKKLKHRSIIYSSMHIGFVSVMFLMIWFISHKSDLYLSNSLELKILSKEMQISFVQHKKESEIREQNSKLFQKDINLRKLYDLIKTNQYPMEILNKIKFAKPQYFMLDSFVYNERDNINGRSVVTFDIDYGQGTNIDEKKYFIGVNFFINSLKHQLPGKEISFYRIANSLAGNSKTSNIPINIKIVEPIE